MFKKVIYKFKKQAGGALSALKIQSNKVIKKTKIVVKQTVIHVNKVLSKTWTRLVSLFQKVVIKIATWLIKPLLCLMDALLLSLLPLMTMLEAMFIFAGEGIQNAEVMDFIPNSIIRILFKYLDKLNSLAVLLGAIAVFIFTKLYVHVTNVIRGNELTEEQSHDLKKIYTSWLQAMINTVAFVMMAEGGYMSCFAIGYLVNQFIDFKEIAKLAFEKSIKDAILDKVKNKINVLKSKKDNELECKIILIELSPVVISPAIILSCTKYVIISKIILIVFILGTIFISFSKIRNQINENRDKI